MVLKLNPPNAFDIYRGYFGFSYRLTPRLTFSAMMDAAAKRNEMGYFDVVLKNLFLDFEYFNGHHLQLGQANVSWVPYMENLVGDRYIQRSFTEEEGYNTSTDMGLMFKGALAKNRFQYHAGLVNGNGWHRPETNQHKDAQGRLTFVPFAQSKGLRQGIFLSVGANKKFYDRSEVKANERLTASRLHFLAGYQSADITTGLEILTTSDPTSKIIVAQPNAISPGSVSGRGYSIFANMRLNAFLGQMPKNGGILIRIDKYNPTLGVLTNDNHTRLMAGPTWTINKNFQFFVGYLETRYDKNARVQKISTNSLAFSAETKF